MPNVSELARLEEEYEDLKNQIKTGYNSKHVKNILLSRVRELEYMLNLESKPYCSGGF
jgi:hypothetical protein